jgi:hypothetical protein
MAKSMLRVSFIVIELAFLGLATPSLADPAAYFAKDIRGEVVDDVSGEVLEGVIAVAQWQLVREVIPGVMNKSYGDSLKIVEVVSGRDGRFVIPGWGPIARPMLFHLENEDPSIVFFKSGYYTRTVANEVLTSYSRDSARVSQWDGKTVRLRKFTGQAQEFVQQDGRFRDQRKVDGSLEEYASGINDIQASMNWTKANSDWKNFPRMVVALARERDRLEAAGLKPKYQIRRASALHGGAGAVDQFLKAHEK